MSASARVMLAAVLAACAGGSALAAAPVHAPALPADVAAWFKAHAGHPGGIDGVSGGSGDLTGHGTHDWAGLATLPPGAMPGDDSDRQTVSVVVFLQQPDGHLKLAAQSAGQTLDCGTSTCEINAVSIERRSVLVSWDGHWHGCGDQVDLRFQLRDGQWPLIGVSSTSSEVPYGEDDNGKPLDGPEVTVVIDHNRLTGAANIVQRTGKRAPRVSHAKVVLPVEVLQGFQNFGVPQDKAFPTTCGRG